jgi:hypothetical protein
MVWSFLWRAALYAPLTAVLCSWVIGFAMGLFGSSAQAVRDVGQVAQVIGFLLGLTSAYLNAKDARAS